jgi:hypothetical protein
VLRHPPVGPADGDDDAVEGGDRPDGLQRPRPPGGDLRIPVGGDLGEEGGRDLDPVELLDHVLNVSRGHALGVEGQDLLVEASDPPLVLGDAFRLEGPVAVAWAVEGDRPERALNGLPGGAVAAVGHR